MKIAILHDLYIPLDSDGVSGEDNLVKLEISLLRKFGHEVIDLRRYATGIQRKILQTTVHVGGVGRVPNIKKGFVDVIHSHNLNQISGYGWLKETDVPVVQSLHNLRSFCPISIGWRNEKHCFDCIKSPLSVIKNRCGGVYGMSGSIRHLVTQRDRPQISKSRRLIASSHMMKDIFSKIYNAEKIDVIHNPGIPDTPIELDQFEERWLYAGRFVQEKGIIDIIRNWPDEEKLDIAGSGPLESQIRSEIKNRSNIQMIGTFKSDNRKIYGRYRGLIFASTWLEGSPLVVADAISNGLPVIAFGNSAVKEQIDISKGGFYCGKEINLIRLRLAIQQVRQAGLSLRKQCQLSGDNVLSTTFWVREIMNSLERAVV